MVRLYAFMASSLVKPYLIILITSIPAGSSSRAQRNPPHFGRSLPADIRSGFDLSYPDDAILENRQEDDGAFGLPLKAPQGPPTTITLNLQIPNPFDNWPRPIQEETDNELPDEGVEVEMEQQQAFPIPPLSPQKPPSAGALPGSSGNVPRPILFNMSRPSCAQPGASWCIDDPKYPAHEVLKAIRFHRLRFLDLYADVADLSTKNSVHNLELLQDESYMCASQTSYARPKRAKNVKGQWRILVNDLYVGFDTFSQSVRVEICSEPGSSCPWVLDCYKTSCTQKYTHNRLLVYDPFDTYFPFAVDLFAFPSSCDCVARGATYLEEEEEDDDDDDDDGGN